MASEPSRRPASQAPVVFPPWREPSTPLWLVSHYFTWTGGLLSVAVVGGLMSAFGGYVPAAEALAAHPFAVIGAAVAAVGLLLTGHDLRQRRRRGAIAAGIGLLAPLAALAGGVSAISWWVAGSAGIGLALLALTWSELE